MPKFVDPVNSQREMDRLLKNPGEYCEKVFDIMKESPNKVWDCSDMALEFNYRHGFNFVATEDFIRVTIMWMTLVALRVEQDKALSQFVEFGWDDGRFMFQLTDKAVEYLLGLS